MKSIFKNTAIGVCALSLLSGCTSKDVAYQDENTKMNKEINYNNVDNKLSDINGDENNVNSEDNYDKSSNDGLQRVTNSSVNSVNSEINGNSILLESIHFNFDKYNLSDAMREVATTNYSKISETKQSYNSLKIKLEGNCDEWGTDEYNYALGLKRAKVAKDALVYDGIDAKSIIMVSFGESNPVCNQKTSACWKMNRRVDYRLLP